MITLESMDTRYEQLEIALGEEMYRQTAGLPYDASKLETLRNDMTHLCGEFLAAFSEPRLMRLGALSSVGYAARLPYRLQLVDERIKKISTPTFTYQNRPVTWATCRQFTAQTTDHKARKQVFDTFIQKAPQLLPLVTEGFHAVNDAYMKYEASPLTTYLELEGLAYSELTTLIQKLGDGARSAFLQAVDHYADEIKHEPFAYYDDYYYFRGHIFQSLNTHLAQLPILDEVQAVLHGLGFPAHQIQVDAEDRPKKSPSAFCYAIQVPSDVRVVYKPVSPGTDLGSVFHEFGHGMHGISGDPKDPSWKRYVVPRSVAETFSFLTESLISNPLFLDETFHLPADVIQEIVDRRRFMNLFFTVFYSANALMKLAFWKNALTCEQASEYWQRLTKRFMIEVPGDYWLIHHIMSNYTIYAPSYLVAAVRVRALLSQLTKKYGDHWWRNPEAGKAIRQLATMRGEFPIEEFSLNSRPYLENIRKLSIL